MLMDISVITSNTFGIVYFISLQSKPIDPSHDAAIKGSKRGQEGKTNEAMFQFRYFFA